MDDYLDGIFLERKEDNQASMREDKTGAIIVGNYYHFFYVPTEEEIWSVAQRLKDMPDDERAKIGLPPRYFGPEHKTLHPIYSSRY